MKTNDAPLGREEFEARLRGMERFYHIHHPFHLAMNEGGLDREAVRGWVANRFYYQIQIPLKDAAILSNCPDRDVRRQWIQRILDHDGYGEDPGGIESWLRLAEAVLRIYGEPHAYEEGMGVCKHKGLDGSMCLLSSRQIVHSDELRAYLAVAEEVTRGD